MAMPEESLLFALERKLVALEKQFLELEQKYNSLSESTRRGTELKDNVTETAEIKPPNAPIGDANAEDKEESSPDSRVKILKRIRDPKTDQRIELPEDSQTSKPEDNNKHAFVLRKIIHDKFSDGEDSSEIDIINPGLWDLLKEHLGGYPNHVFRGLPVTLFSPYEAIIFGWDALNEAADQAPKNEQDKRAREDLKLLLDILSGGSSGDSELDKYFKARAVYVEEEMVQYDDLWTIFPPGTLIYGKAFQNQDQVFIVQDNELTWPERSDRPQQLLSWELSCWTYDWTGENFQRTAFMLVFEPFEGHRPITALPYYPFKLHPDHDTVKDKLIKRGHKFLELCTAKEGNRLFEYKGDALFGKKGFSGLLQDDDDDSDYRSRLIRHRSIPVPVMEVMEPNKPVAMKSSHVESRVMVDYLSYFQYGPSIVRNGALGPSTMDPDCICSDCQKNKDLAAKYRTHFDKVHAQGMIWEDEQYMLCPPRVLGYVLRDKQWAQLQVTLINDISEDDPGTAWHSRLQLSDDRIKDLLFDLVRSHTVSTPKKTGEPKHMDLEVDIIPGKGKGLVILLYGPPGVGKTSTAETIAVATRKPLFSISVADVGTKAKHVESNLSKIFFLATLWQAILLIDEADVFLESRGRSPATSTTDKNALVSVFLRVLEYYQGIMFLTTNQIAHFDVAIPSRIHISIQYESLKPSQMEKIFKGFINPLYKNGLVDDYKGILEWLNDDVYDIGFDGRQIRNIVTTALGLARAEAKDKKGKGKLGKKHLKSVVQNGRSFKDDFRVQYDRYITAQEKMIK